MAENVLKTYTIKSDEVELEVNIIEDKKAFVRRYNLNFPQYGEGTKALLTNLKSSLLGEVKLSTEKLLDAKFMEHLKKDFSERAQKMLRTGVAKLSENDEKIITNELLNQMLGLGQIEFLLADPNLEEVVINGASDPVWVYSKEFGWLKTNVWINTEPEIENYASIIARRVGKQITTLTPLLDAHLVTGDRANATLYPISGKGNTITIRRFRRDPWTVVDFIKNKTLSSELMALVWEAIEYESNVIFSGGTASGKTSVLGVCIPFIQPNHRMISIEDTREVQPPEFMHWVPLTTREPNPEGKGGVNMLDLLVNSLRMRPDRIIVGEIRRQREAEVMFEAMHTGHSVYTTFHANTAEETIRRFTNPPISIPASMLDSVHLNIVMFRNRKLGIRRPLQVAEFVPERRGEGQETLKANIIYRWRGANDTISKQNESLRLYDDLALHTGLSKKEIDDEINEKKQILDWMVKNDLPNVNTVGKVIGNYYMNPDDVFNLVKKNKKPQDVIGE